MNNAWREHSNQQTTTGFYRYRIKFIFHNQISKLRERATALSRLKNFLDCGDKSPLSKRRHIGAVQRQIRNKSNEESARWLKRRLLPKRFCGRIFLLQQLKLRRRDQNKILFCRQEFQLLRLQIESGLLFRLFSGGDGLAKWAGMVSIEGFRHGFFDGLCAKIISEHRRPRDGLQQRPMRSEHRHERDDEENFAKPNEHNVILAKNFTKSR